MDIQGFFGRWGWFLALGAAAFAVAYLFIGRKNKPQASTTATGMLAGQSSQAGANGQPVIEYVPTTGDTYTSINEAYNSYNAAPPAPTAAPPPVTTPQPPPTPAPPVTGNPGGPLPPTPSPVPPGPQRPPSVPPPPPTRQPPIPPPAPKPTVQPPQPRYTQYTIQRGDTLSAIASRFKVTWQNLYTLNKSAIDQMAASHNYPIPGGPWNNIWPGEKIQVPA